MYYSIVEEAKSIFADKLKDYGTSWKFYRHISLTDQIFIKASRIRKIEETEETKINEPIEIELKGIINYGVIAIMLLEYDKFPEDEILEYYQNIIDNVYNLMVMKNTDYDNAWTVMETKSFTDIILVRCARLKKLLANKDPEKDKIKDQFIDIINYAVFYLIKLQFPNELKEIISIPQ